MNTALARASYRDIDLYAPNRAPCRIDLSDNTNAWGMPPAARAAISDATSVVRYPSLYADGLKAALSAYTGLPVEMITTGCGSDDVLDSTIRAFAEPGDRIAYPEPTFPMIPIFARMNGLIPVPTPIGQLAESAARILYICSPNNPSGSVVARAAIEDLLRRSAGNQVVIIDEAYAEFAGVNSLDLISTCDRLVITRTMSKAFGLAGLRIGYALGQPGIIAEVEKSRGPYKVSAIAERAAVAALTAGAAWVGEHVALVIANRRRFENALTERGLAPVPSSANFVFFPIDRAADIAREMRARGVAVRAFDAPSGLRVTIGPWELLGETLDVFDEARRACE